MKFMAGRDLGLAADEEKRRIVNLLVEKERNSFRRSLKFEQLNEHKRNINARHDERILPSCTNISLLEQQPSVGCLCLESGPNKFDWNINYSFWREKKREFDRCNMG